MNINNHLAKALVLNVLREALDKLAILKYINGWSEDDQTIVEYQTIEEQCNTIKNDDVIPPMSKDNVDLLDFRRDCSFIESTIQKTYDEIASKGTYGILAALSDIFTRLQGEEAQLLKETHDKELKYINLHNCYYEERDVYRKQIHEAMVQIGNLKDEIEDFMQEADIKSNYLEKWMKSKSETNCYELRGKERMISEVIMDKKQEFVKEDRAHLEVANIYNETDLELQKEIKKWKYRYESDSATLSKKILNLREAIAAQNKKTTDMLKKFKMRNDEIEAYEIHKEEQEKKRVEREKKDRAATKIQAWWRGVMVRKGFGRYKKKEKKKNKKKVEEKKRKV
ncbi:dynein regulatory complex protein 9-like [Euwallacea similis]|uniref:dynein regulatory complex protein 9-like n=1 Tax=Euwallacea similis TaxID=1736056 RepID=UPI00344E8007